MQGARLSNSPRNQGFVTRHVFLSNKLVDDQKAICVVGVYLLL
jgi:hypothetical protein